ncbi:MAG: cation-transporting ATPase [Microbacterium sp.]|jgi:hypothetical protein|nr:cation-transporting ATPase [Microbacterium sp.]
MGSLNRLFDLAAKALDSSGSQAASGSQASASGRDWRAMVRDVAGAVSGEPRSATPPTASGVWTPPASPAPGVGLTPPAAPGVDVTPPAAHGVGITPPAPSASAAPGGAATPTAADRAAIARYEYLLQTSDPHQVEAIHREAFARLTAQQRAQVQAGMRSELRPSEQPRTAEAPELARAAARTEALRPGAMAGLLARVSRSGRAPRGGGMAKSAALVGAGGLLGAVAGAAVVSAVAAPLLAQAVATGIDFDAIAGAVDLDAIAGGVDLGGAGDLVSGAGEAVSGIGEQLSNFEIPGLGGLGDLFGR